VAANDNAAADPMVLRIAPSGERKIVKNLMPGYRVRTVLNGALMDGVIARGTGLEHLTVVELELDLTPRRVYNFEVEGLLSYAVGELGAWVHNDAHIACWICDCAGNVIYLGSGSPGRVSVSARQKADSSATQSILKVEAASVARLAGSKAGSTKGWDR
jgi:hypothetical protein